MNASQVLDTKIQDIFLSYSSHLCEENDISPHFTGGKAWTYEDTVRSDK